MSPGDRARNQTDYIMIQEMAVIIAECEDTTRR